MKNPLPALLASALCSLFVPAQAARAQGTALTYQGRLNDAAGPATGTYDFQFTVRDALTGGSPVGVNPLAATLAVSNGLFTATIDPGAGVFTGPDRWLEIAVRTNGAELFTTLSPRQPVLPTPYALYSSSAGTATTAGSATTAASATTAGSASTAGSANTANTATTANTALAVAANAVGTAGVQDGTMTAAKLAPGQVVKALNGLTDVVTLNAGSNVTLIPSGNTLTIAASAPPGTNAWNLTGNSNTTSANFLGTLDNKVIEFRVNNRRVLRLEPATTSTGNSAPNVIGGALQNLAGPGTYGVTIAGGSDLNSPHIVESPYGAVGGGYFNRIRTNSDSSTIAGGTANTIQSNSPSATIGGGIVNTIATNGGSSVIAGGSFNGIVRGANYATISGGTGNTNSGYAAVVGGGQFNLASGPLATVPGGTENTASGQESFAAGHRAQATHQSAFVWSDSSDTNYFGSTASHQFLIRATNGVGIGTNNPQSQLHVRGTVTADLYRGDGSGLSNLNINTASLLAANQTWTGSNTYSGVLSASNAANRFAGLFTGDGSGLSNLVVGSAGTNTALLPGNQTFSGSNTFQGVVKATNVNNMFTGMFTGNGAAVTNLNLANTVGNAALQSNAVTASKIASGQVVKTLNGLTDAVTLSAGANVSLATNLNSLIISAAASGGASSNAWNLTGNVGTLGGSNFIGTTDNQPLDFRAFNNRMLRLDGNRGNIIAGLYNSISNGVGSATISGGGDFFSPNRVSDNLGTIGGGFANVAGNDTSDFNDGSAATVAGGYANQAAGASSTISGGSRNTNSGLGGVIAGGELNRATAAHAVISGGWSNRANGAKSTVPGGQDNAANGDWSYAAGRQAKAQHQGAHVWADSTPADFASTANDQFLIRAAGGVGIGTNNPQSALHVNGAVTATAFNGPALSAPVDFQANSVRALRLDPGIGGVPNIIAGPPANQVDPSVGGAVIAGGISNTVLAGANFATIAGGYSNSAAGVAGFAAGQRANAAHHGAFVWSDGSSATPFSSSASNQFLIRADGGVGIGTSNPVEQLEVRAPNATVALRNSQDLIGAFVGNVSNALQVGLYNPSASQVGVVPPGSKKTFFAVDSLGRVGSVGAADFGSNAFNNLLDDGAGNTILAGNVTIGSAPSSGGLVKGPASPQNITENGWLSVAKYILVNTPAPNPAPANGTITAAGTITATTGDLVATAGRVTAGTMISAGGTITAGSTITAASGDVVATAGKVRAGTDVIAGGVINAGGNIATPLDISGRNVTAGGNITANGTVTIKNVGALVIEPRASDPPAPVTGQIWLLQ